MVAGAVRSGDPGPIEHDGHACPVQGDVHQHLVERPVEEGGVQRDDGVQAAGGQSRRGGQGVLLGDAHVEGPGRVGRLEPSQAGGVQHGGRDGDDALVRGGELHDLLGEDVGPGGRDLGRQRFAGELVDAADRVEVVFVVILGCLEPPALRREAVHDHRTAEVLRQRQSPLHGGDVMAVDGTDVLHAEIGEEALGGQHVLDARLESVQEVVGVTAHQRRGRHRALHDGEQLLVATIGAQRRQLVGEPADGRGVGAAVVVDDHDQGQVLLSRDVVEGFPGHAAGEGTVTDHRYHRAALTAKLERLRQTLGP